MFYVKKCSLYVVQVQWYNNDSFINQNPVYHYRYVKHLTNNNTQKIPTNSKGASSRLPILIKHPHVDYRESLTDYTTSFLADVHQYVTWRKILITHDICSYRFSLLILLNTI